MAGYLGGAAAIEMAVKAQQLQPIKRRDVALIRRLIQSLSVAADLMEASVSVNRIDPEGGHPSTTVRPGERP